MSAKYITEILKELNDDTKLLTTTYKKTGENGLLEILFKHAYLPEHRFVLPAGNPPYKSHSSPIGMTPALFIQEIRKFSIFTRRDINNIKRELLFIQTLENIHPSEAKILLAIKDQELTKLYPNLTYKVLANSGYLPQRNDIVEEVTPEVTPEISPEVAPKATTRATTKTPAKPRKTTTKVTKEVVEPVVEPSVEPSVENITLTEI